MLIIFNNSIISSFLSFPLFANSIVFYLEFFSIFLILLLSLKFLFFSQHSFSSLLLPSPFQLPPRVPSRASLSPRVVSNGQRDTERHEEARSSSFSSVSTRLIARSRTTGIKLLAVGAPRLSCVLLFPGPVINSSTDQIYDDQEEEREERGGGKKGRGPVVRFFHMN